MTLNPGATVTHRSYGAAAFVVRRWRPDGLIDVMGKATGGVSYPVLPASPSDLTEVTPAPTFSPGALIVRGGIDHTVLADLGDAVVLGVGESFHPLKHGGRLRLPAGNSVTVAKSDIVLDQMGV